MWLSCVLPGQRATRFVNIPEFFIKIIILLSLKSTDSKLQEWHLHIKKKITK